MKKTLWEVNENLATLKTADEVLSATGLDFEVKKRKALMQTPKGFKVIPNTFVTCIEDELNTTFGIVSDRYKIVQNNEAFDFVTNLIEDNNFTVETGEMINNTVLIGGSIGQRYIEYKDMVIECKIAITNRHDGKGGIKVNILPIFNGKVLNIPIKKSKREFAVKHTTNVDSRMNNAKNTLDFSRSYFEMVINESNRLSVKEFTSDNKRQFVEVLFPMDEKLSKIKERNTITKREVMLSYLASAKNAWQVLMGVADYIATADPIRNAPTFEDSRRENIMNGDKLLDNAYEVLVKNLAK